MINTARQKAKFIKLLRRLRPLCTCQMVDVETIAVGILERLWHAATTSAPRGDIGKLDDDIIAELCGWYGEPKILIEILVDCRWLDRSPEHRLLVHDWADHAPNHVKGNVSRHGGFHGEKHENQEAPQGTLPREPPKGASPRDAPQGTVPPNQTKPNQTKKEKSKPKKKFKKPTIEEVAAYCAERKNRIDPERFFDHYESNGWRIGGKGPMSDWQASVRQWERNEVNNGTGKQRGHPGPNPSRVQATDEKLALYEEKCNRFNPPQDSGDAENGLYPVGES